MDTITAQKLEYILSGYRVTMEDRDAIIDLMDEYAGTVANKNIVLPAVMRSVCCNSELINFNKDYDQCFVCEKIQKKQTDA